MPLSGPRSIASCPSICRCSSSLARVLVTPSTCQRRSAKVSPTPLSRNVLVGERIERSRGGRER